MNGTICYTSNRVARVCLHKLSFLFSHSHGAASNPAGFSAPSATFRSPFSPTAVQLSRTQLIRRSRAVESVPWCRGIRLFSKSCLICSVVRWNTARKQSCASDASGILDNSRGAAASGADATVYADDDDGDAVMVVSNVMSPSTAAAVALIAAGFNSDMGAQPILRPRPCVARARACPWRCGAQYLPSQKMNKLCGRPPQYAPAPCKLTISSYIFARWRGCSGMLAV